MTPALRRIVAVEAHRRRTSRLPRTVHALGTGESFVMAETPDGFVDVATGIAVRAEAARILLEDGAAIAFALEDDVSFGGYDPETRERFTGRAGGGASVTVYGPRGDYFQYAMLEFEG